MTFLFGDSIYCRAKRPTHGWALGELETRNVGSRPRCDAIRVGPVAHDVIDCRCSSMAGGIALHSFPLNSVPNSRGIEYGVSGTRKKSVVL